MRGIKLRVFPPLLHACWEYIMWQQSCFSDFHHWQNSYTWFASLLLIAVIKTMAESCLWRKCSVQLTVYSPYWREVRAGTQAVPWRSGVKPRPGRNTAYCLVSHGFLSFLSYTTQNTCTWVVLFKVGWALLHQSFISKMPGHTYEPTW